MEIGRAGVLEWEERMGSRGRGQKLLPPVGHPVGGMGCGLHHGGRGKGKRLQWE